MLHLTKVFPNGLHDLLLIDFDPFYQSVIPWGRSNRDVWNPSGSEQRLQHRVSCCVMSSRFPGILRMVEFEEPSWQLSLLIQKHSQSYYSAIVGHLIRWSSHVTCLYKLYLFFFSEKTSFNFLSHVQSLSKLCIIVSIANINGHVYPVQSGYIPLHLRLFFGQVLQWKHWLSIVC